MKRTLLIVWLLTLVAAIGIAPIAATGTRESIPEDRHDTDAQDPPTALTVEQLIEGADVLADVARYAAGFSAYENGSLTIVEVSRPWQNAAPEDTIHYILYPDGDEEPVVEGADRTIAVPIDSIVTMSTTFLPHLSALEELDSLAAVDSAAYAYTSQVHEMRESGDLLEVGSGPTVDVEKLLAVDPDIILVNSFGGEWDSQPVLEEAGLPVVVSGDWVENAPLGRAEWFLFTSLFFDKLDTALSVFREIEREYSRLEALVADQADRPEVLVNAPYQGTWSVPGGASYMARFIEDAGGDYVWSDDDSVGALFLDVESVYAEAGEADVWINPGTWTSLAMGAAEDERFTNFKAFESGDVYNANRRIGPGGGNDYFESGAMNPHVVLNDLIWVFHPELVSDYEPYYFQKLQ
jgi:iron complex transport system substrate-binding protein